VMRKCSGTPGVGTCLDRIFPVQKCVVAATVTRECSAFSLPSQFFVDGTKSISFLTLARLPSIALFPPTDAAMVLVIHKVLLLLLLLLLFFVVVVVVVVVVFSFVHTMTQKCVAFLLALLFFSSPLDFCGACVGHLAANATGMRCVWASTCVPWQPSRAANAVCFFGSQSDRITFINRKLRVV
jgi:hypothetical protein